MGQDNHGQGSAQRHSDKYSLSSVYVERTSGNGLGISKDENMLNLLDGIVAGLLTTLLVFMGTYIWKIAVQPWIRELLYEGIRVDGTWSLLENEDTDYIQHETFELDQHAGILSGRLILVSKGNPTDSRTLVITGLVRDGFVILTGTPNSERSLGYLAFVGRVAGDGNSIQGHASFFGINTGEFEGLPAVYKRC
jgi:hypothetical protein